MMIQTSRGKIRYPSPIDLFFTLISFSYNFVWFFLLLEIVCIPSNRDIICIGHDKLCPCYFYPFSFFEGSKMKRRYKVIFLIDLGWLGSKSIYPDFDITQSNLKMTG